jgi:hypothetical protein
VKNISLRIFEKMILRRISGHKREEVVEGLRKLHNEELHNLLVRFTRHGRGM